MGDSVRLGVIAIGLGVIVGIVLFVPFVAVQYRRAGHLTAGQFALWAAALVYFCAIWTYTLLPLPEPAGMRCAGVNLNPLQLIDDLRGAARRADGSPRAFLADVAVLQLALNVLLLLPLGFFLRVLGRRGILVAFAAGLGISLVIEFTQLTGVWGIYPCAYRVFDVDDLLTNTAGAVLGSILAFAVPRRAPRDEPDAPRPVTRGRRILAMACDLLAYTVVGIVVSVVVQLAFAVTGNRDVALAGDIAGQAGSIAALAVVVGCVVVSGRSIGDVAVRLRYRGVAPAPAAVSRLARLIGGIGGYALLDQLPDGWGLLTAAFALAALVVALATPDGRGLPGMLGRLELRDSREDRPAGRSDISRSGDARGSDRP
ncbi:VanZ family protein [Microbacterium sp. cf332]|uniref:VanZ family protein n=1 Tax=Microbacterium sp. cf332 TaxID=1761804 RepID=UPI000883A04E|nr:VanZ family protein [Microbacterium sp. cf332]SDQ43532.1 Glycopeptide antibiotics resistance protein [Microbacterium sp. cf332]